MSENTSLKASVCLCNLLLWQARCFNIRSDFHYFPSFFPSLSLPPRSGHNESFNVNILQSFHSLFYINNTSKVKPECRHTFLLICTKQPLYHLACYHFFFLLYCNTRALLMRFLHHDACDFLAAVVWDVFCFALSLTGM